MSKARPAVYLRDASVVVGATWIALVGFGLARLVLGDGLATGEVLRVLLITTIVVPVAWIAITGLAFLVVKAEGGSLDVPRALTISGVAAVPFVIALVIATIIVLALTTLGIDGPLARLVPSIVLWLGILLGVPGAYFAKLLIKNTLVAPHAALTVSLFLVAIAALVFSFFTYVIPV